MWFLCYNPGRIYTTPFNIIHDGLYHRDDLKLTCHGGSKNLEIQKTFGKTNTKVLFTTQQLIKYE